jgi:AmmeMemoRadiSam system protein A
MKGEDHAPIVGLNEEEKEYLLQLARETIISIIKENKFPETNPTSERLKRSFGVFVTLHKKGTLRGCIGYIEGFAPLYKSVMENAKSAAFNDPRFPPVEAEEIDDLDIEISVLSPLTRIKNLKDIQVGTHGILLKRHINRGLLLPQVAVEWDWERKTFLQQTCNKAGLPSDAWKDPETEIYIFSAEIFNESEK